MKIKKIIQGKDIKSDQQMFGYIGHWLVDKKIHEYLGTAITSQVGDIWYIILDDEIPLGFCQIRLLKKSIHIRFLYCIKQELCTELLTYILMQINTNEFDYVYTNDRETSEIWSKLGFGKTSKAKSSFCRWQKELKEK